MNTQTIHINLPHIQEIANTGVRRAALFMGIGINTAMNPDFVDYQLHKAQGEHPTIAPDFLPRDSDKETIEGYKQEFSVWITGCGFREILEFYGLTLNHIHRFALLVKTQDVNQKFSKEPSKAHSEFYKTPSISRKIQLLQEGFGITPKYPEALSAFHYARNALTHGLGYVRKDDCTEDGILRLKWLIMDVYGEGHETGDKTPFTEMVGKATTEPVSLMLEVKEKEKVFKLGEKVVLTAGDLWEICFFFQTQSIPSLIESFTIYLQESKIRWNEN